MTLAALPDAAIELLLSATADNDCRRFHRAMHDALASELERRAVPWSTTPGPVFLPLLDAAECASARRECLDAVGHLERLALACSDAERRAALTAAADFMFAIAPAAPAETRAPCQM